MLWRCNSHKALAKLTECKLKLQWDIVLVNCSKLPANYLLTMSLCQNTNHIICYFNIYFKNYISPTRQQPHLHRGITAAKTAKSVTRHNAIEPEASKLIKSIIVFGNCSCTVSQTSSMKYYAPAPANKIVKTTIKIKI